AETGGAECHAMDRRMLLQHGLEIPGRDQVGKLDECDVFPFGEEGPCPRRQCLGNENLLLVGGNFLPLGFLVRRQRTAPVPSFSRCILLRSTANRSGAPSRAPAFGSTRPQTCVPSSVK